MKTLGTKEKILKEGRALLQRHGYNGFSFQDIANIVGIKKPSLYDHYASKEELIAGILENYSQSFDKWALQIEALSPLEKIQKAFDVFYSFSCDKKKVCPVLALTADIQILSKQTHNEMQLFLNKWLHWLEATILEGQKDGSIRKDLPAKNLAEFLYNQGMGAQIQARLMNRPEIIMESSKLALRFLKQKS